MYFANGGINTCFLFGFAEQVSGTEMLLHVIADSRTALKVRCDGARLPAYTYEPVILAGSMVRDEDGTAVFLARHTLAASKAHVPRKIIWRLDRCQDLLGWSPINPADKFRVTPEVLDRLPGRVDWPEEVRAFAMREGGLFDQMLTEALSQKRCWGVGLVAGFAELRDIVTSEDEAPTAHIRVRLRPEKDAPSFDARLSMGVAGSHAAIETLRLRDPRRSPVAAVVRPLLLHDPLVGNAGDRPSHRWGFRVESLHEAGANEIRDPRSFLARRRPSPNIAA